MKYIKILYILIYFISLESRPHELMCYIEDSKLLRVFLGLEMLSELCASALAWSTAMAHKYTGNKIAVNWAKRYWADLTNRQLDGKVNDAFTADTIPHGKKNTRELCDQLEQDLSDAKLVHEPGQEQEQEPGPVSLELLDMNFDLNPLLSPQCSLSPTNSHVSTDLFCTDFDPLNPFSASL